MISNGGGFFATLERIAEAGTQGFSSLSSGLGSSLLTASRAGSSFNSSAESSYASGTDNSLIAVSSESISCPWIGVPEVSVARFSSSIARSSMNVALASSPGLSCNIPNVVEELSFSVVEEDVSWVLAFER